MSVSVVMPQLGESVTEGTVTRWLKKEGEHVTADEPLLEVSTDKVDTEIPSPASGILRGIAVDEDETVAVGAQLAVIEDSDSADAPAPAEAPAAPAAQAPAAPAPAAGPRPRRAGARRAAGPGRAPRLRPARPGPRRGRPRQRRVGRPVEHLVVGHSVRPGDAGLRSACHPRPRRVHPAAPARAARAGPGRRPGRGGRVGRRVPGAHAAAVRRLAVRHPARTQARRRARRAA